MSAAITCTPEAPVATTSACRIDVTGADANDTADYDADAYPSRAEIRNYLRFVKGGVEYGRSYVFAAGQDGTHSFPNYIFPSSGSWTVTLNRADTDAQLATLGVTVS
jgi:hypothetical protein